MVTKKEVRALIEAIKEREDIKQKATILSMIDYYIGGVTNKEKEESRNN